MKQFIAFAVLAAVFGSIAVYVYGINSNPPIVQPVDFNHYKHVKASGMACADCHKYVSSDHMASIPNVESCKLCHNEETLPDDPAAKEKVLKVVEFVKAGKQIPWNRLFELPDHVYFSHRTHTVFGSIKCEECHGDMGSQTSPMPHPFRTFTMDDCISCHTDRKVSVDCIVCHK